MDQERRSFLRFAIHGLGALFAAILGIPAIFYLFDARNWARAASGFRPVDGVRKGELELGKPKQGVIRDVRKDAWTLHPNDVIGRVWVLKHGTGDNDMHVWTTICPHLGCSINANAGGGFTCPCHGAEFTGDGSLVSRPNFSNPAPRGMDTLEWEWKEQVLMVKYQNFRQGEHHKIPKA